MRYTIKYNIGSKSNQLIFDDAANILTDNFTQMFNLEAKIYIEGHDSITFGQLYDCVLDAAEVAFSNKKLTPAEYQYVIQSILDIGKKKTARNIIYQGYISNKQLSKQIADLIIRRESKMIDIIDYYEAIRYLEMDVPYSHTLCISKYNKVQFVQIKELTGVADILYRRHRCGMQEERAETYESLIRVGRYFYALKYLVEFIRHYGSGSVIREAEKCFNECGITRYIQSDKDKVLVF